MLEMAKRDILPAALRYSGDLAAAVCGEAGACRIGSEVERELAETGCPPFALPYISGSARWSAAVQDAANSGDAEACAMYYKDPCFHRHAGAAGGGRRAGGAHRQDAIGPIPPTGICFSASDRPERRYIVKTGWHKGVQTAR